MPTIKDFTPRIYQESILNTSVKSNTLIVLPTGLGKTKTAILIAMQRLNTYPQSKVLFLTPTKPLGSQIQKEFIAHTTLEKDQIKLFTGMIRPDERERMWQDAKIIVSTPQGCANDIVNSKMKLDDVSCLIFDEVHHAVGSYDYCFIAKQYQQTAKYPRIIGLTASPGSDQETITEICKNTFIEAIETRTHEDDDVKPYVQEVDFEYITVDLPEEMKAVTKILQGCLDKRLQRLKDIGAISTTSVGKGLLLEAQKDIQKRIISGEKDHSVWLSATAVAEAIKVHYALELAETQGISTLDKYFNKIYEEAEKTKTKATKNLAADSEFKEAYLKTAELKSKNIDHPKLEKLKELILEEVTKNKNARIIIFTNYRDSGSKIVEELNHMPGVDSKLFVGQAKKGTTGMSQKEQLQMLEEFKQSLFNIVVATSIGEEGLDIASVNLVVFYEPVPSAIRSIQRKGRTARLEKGAVKILVTKNTRDEASRWTAYHKEKRMHRLLGDLKNKIKLTKQDTLEKFTEENKIKIYADHREANSGILKELKDLDVDIHLQNLAVADFLVSERVCIERKSVSDFLSSIIDKRLMQQLKAMRDNYERPIIILEGTDDIYNVRNIHPNAIRGVMATITVDYGIPIVRTRDIKDTAALLKIMAKHEQQSEEKDFGVRTERKPLTTKEQQEFIIESLPGVGATLAKSLLKELKTVKNIVNATEDELTKIEKIGKKKAAEIQRILEEKYEAD